MKKLGTALLLAGVLSLSGVARVAVASDGGAKSVDDAWTKAILANDVAAVAACYADDAVLVLPGSPAIEGKKAITEALTGFLGDVKVTAFSMSNSKYRTSGGLSVSWGHWSMTTVPKTGGSPTTVTGTHSEVAVKQGKRWVYLSDHAAGDPPPPKAAGK